MRISITPRRPESVLPEIAPRPIPTAMTPLIEIRSIPDGAKKSAYGHDAPTMETASRQTEPTNMHATRFRW